MHEDWGSTPAAIDAALTGAERWGLQVALHSDSLNEAGFVASTIAAFRGRSISAFHVEGAGGGHAPDILTIAGLPNVLPGSTNPTLPHTVNTVAEHLDMLMVCHHLNPAVPEDLAFAESRIRATTIAAEDHLHDLGAISITSSDAQAMGRIGEVITRTWQVAHVMKQVRGALAGGLPADNFRARRYVAKYTINPAISHGVDHEIGSVEVGKLADLVLWDPRFFGVSPSVVIKGGGIVVGALGDPNASIPTPQPVLMRPALYGPGAPTCRSRTSLRPRSRTDWPTSWGWSRPRGDQADPRGRQGGHDQQRRAAGDRDRPGDARDHRRRRPDHPGPGDRAAVGPALQAVLNAGLAHAELSTLRSLGRPRHLTTRRT